MAFTIIRCFIFRLALFPCLAFSCVSAPVYALFQRGERREAPRAIGAVLDLTVWDFERDGPVDLAGEWAFHPGELLDSAVAATWETTRIVPDTWSGAEAGGSWGTGSGTYRLLVLLGGDGVKLGIKVPTVSTAFELDANGVTIAHAGRPALLARDAIAGCFTGVSRVPDPGAPGALVRELVLVVRVSNHEYREGGMWQSFVLGREDDLSAAKRFSDYRTLIFFGATLATAVVFLLLFRNTRREFGNLYFAGLVLRSRSAPSLPKTTCLPP